MKDNNENFIEICKDENSAERSVLCYPSVIALCLAIIISFMVANIRDVIGLSIIAFIIATVSLIIIKRSDGKLRGKVIAILAIAISLTHMLLYIFVVLVAWCQG